jgi:hypothetical protein
VFAAQGKQLVVVVVLVLVLPVRASIGTSAQHFHDAPGVGIEPWRSRLLGSTTTTTTTTTQTVLASC